MRFLIIGFGSIGRRHTSNLGSLGYKNIAILRSSKKLDNPQKNFINKHNPRFFYNSPDAFNWKPDAVIAANPTSMHIPAAKKAILSGAHVFIEKPLSNSISGISELLRIAKKNKKIVKVGYHFRYHPQLQQLKKMLDKNFLGKIFFARFTTGEYLPDWHPWEDYRKGYAARKDLGGGVILTQSHDIDLACWLFGIPTKIKSHFKNSGLLKIDAEDEAEIVFEYKNPMIVSLHLDYLSRPPVKKLQIYGEKGQLEWNYYENSLKITDTKGKNKTKILKNFERNQMYIDELKEFIYAVKTGKTPKNKGEEAGVILETILASKNS